MSYIKPDQLPEYSGRDYNFVVVANEKGQVFENVPVNKFTFQNKENAIFEIERIFKEGGIPLIIPFNNKPELHAVSN